jgi:hypothetical protein
MMACATLICSAAGVGRRTPAARRFAEIERLAKAFCGHGENLDLLAQARIIAANALALRAIGAQKIAVVERLRESTAIALAKGDNSLELATARSIQSWLASKEIDELVPKVFEKYKDQIEGKGQAAHFELIVPGRITALLKWSDSIEHERRARETARKLVEEQERDEFQALEEVAADLIRLDRYERRCWSRQMRAIRNFMNLGCLILTQSQRLTSRTTNRGPCVPKSIITCKAA